MTLKIGLVEDSNLQGFLRGRDLDGIISSKMSIPSVVTGNFGEVFLILTIYPRWSMYGIFTYKTGSFMG